VEAVVEVAEVVEEGERELEQLLLQLEAQPRVERPLEAAEARQPGREVRQRPEPGGGSSERPPSEEGEEASYSAARGQPPTCPRIW